MSKRLAVLITIAAVILGVVLLLRVGSGSTTALWKLSNGGRWLLPLVVVSALIDSLNPCAYSVLILTIAFLFSIGRLRSDVLKVGASYVLGIFLVYIAIGLGILQTLHLFNTPHFMAKVGASLLIILGSINVINEFFPSFPIKLRIPQGAHRTMAEFMNKASLPAAFLLGGLVGLCEFPCTGGPYLLVLGLLHDHVTFFLGLGYLVFYNLLFVLPLVIVLLMASDKGLFEKVSEWKRSNNVKMKLWGGIAMVLLGVVIFLF